MHLLLCAATPFEIAPVMDSIQKEPMTGVEILITGIGMMATTRALTESIKTKRPRFILQAGVAGCIDEELPLTKIVLVEHETIGDLGVEEDGKFKNIFDLGLQDRDTFPWKNGRLTNPVEVLKKSGLKIVTGVTVNEISTQGERILYYRNELGAQVESMEGAALHYVALLENIPFLQIRSLSNFAGERDKKKWMMKEAIASLNVELKRMLSKF